MRDFLPAPIFIPQICLFLNGFDKGNHKIGVLAPWSAKTMNGMLVHRRVTGTRGEQVSLYGIHRQKESP